MRFKNIIWGGSFLLFISISCKKIVEINPPTNSITTSEVFADSADAVSAVLGIYNNLSNNQNYYLANGGITIFCGSSADELIPFVSSPSFEQFSANTVTADNGNILSFIWTPAYQILYQCNAVIEGLEASTGVSQTLTKQLVSEAEFLRAFINFYLVNLYGDVPLVTTIDYKSNSLIFRTSTASVYSSIIKDLTDAKNNLASDYSAGEGERIRANKWAAMALLARAYLYEKDYPSADSAATEIINNTALYSLDTLNGVFLINSTEAILQWQINPNTNPYGIATIEGDKLIPFNARSRPSFYLNQQLLNAFEKGDLRRVNWVDSTNYSGEYFYYPFKYKIGPQQAYSTTTPFEYYTVLRLAEQYLIRAEAQANGAGGGKDAAITDLNIIRTRAGLPNLSLPMSITQVLAAVLQERRIELFAEFGHRWLDLKRTGEAHSILSSISYKQPWLGDYQLLYPIPLAELQLDPNLTQNPGY
jgi:hypothetical protein